MYTVQFLLLITVLWLYKIREMEIWGEGHPGTPLFSQLWCESTIILKSKIKTKTQWYTTIYRLRWLKNKHMKQKWIIRSPGKDVEQLELNLHCWWEGKRVQPLRKQVVSYKVKHIIQASSSTLRHLPMRNENLCSHRNP